MDETNSLIGSKRQKSGDEEDIRVNDSGINNLDVLPQHILIEIISCLPLRDAMRTSVLSKPWKDRWKSTSKIKVKEPEHRNRRQFRNFVDKLLTLCNSRLTKFSLRCDVRLDTRQVTQWLSGFIKPTIQELKLRFDRVYEQLVLPSHLFTSQSLTILHLTMPNVINLPSSIHFPSLKILTLKDVTFPDTTRTQQLFAGCPSLQELSLIDCIWVNVTDVWLVCPLLQSLIIREWRDEESDDDEEEEAEYDDDALFQNVEPLPFCVIMIHESNNLKKFSYDGDLLNYYSLSSTSVTDGTLELHSPPHNSILHPGYFVFKLLMAFLNVEKLSITHHVIETLSHSPDFIKVLPLFNNLVELHVKSFAPVDLSCAVMQTIFRHAPNLEVLEFHRGVVLCENSVNKIDPIPECFEAHMKTIRIYEFTGTVEEMVALKYLIQWTTLKGMMIISSGYKFDGDEGQESLDELWEKIQKLPGAAEIPDLIFE